MPKSSPFGKFPCPNCEQVFTLKANRNRHIARKHTQKQEERYQCAICHKQYSTKCYLKDHIRIVHRHDKTILSECKICFKKFSSRNAARDHQRYKHNITYVSPVRLFTCDHCNRQFNKKCNMQVHIMYSPCNPFRIIRKKMQCPHCGVECLENRSRDHIRMCAARQAMGSDVQPKQNKRRTKEKVYSVTENAKRKIEIANFKNDMLGDNIDFLNMPVKVEDIDESAMEDVASANSKINTLRRSNRKRKSVNYEVLDGDDFTVSDSEPTHICEPFGTQKAYRINDYIIKLEAPESELATLDMDEPDIDIVNCDSETEHNSLSSEDVSSVFSSNILINSKISYSVYEDFSKCTEVSLDGVSSNNAAGKNSISSTNVLDDKTITMQRNTEEIDVMNVSRSNDSETSDTQLQQIKNEQVDTRTEMYADSSQNKAFISSALKREIETDLAAEEEELMRLVHSELATSEICHREYSDDAKSETMKDLRYYKYLGII